MAVVDITGFERHRRDRALKELENKPSKEDQVEQSMDQEQSDVVDDVEPTAVKSIDDMTKNEIMAQLDELNIEYNPRDNKETLKGLLANGDN